MKYIIIVLLTFITIFSLNSMKFDHIKKSNPTVTTAATTFSPKEIQKINATLNKKYSSNLFPNALAVLQLTETDMLSILNSTNSHVSSDILDASYQELYEKNIFFKKALDYFTAMAYQNIEKVTWETLEIIENPSLQQPTPQLNQLPPSIKKYIMDKAQSQIDCNYHMTITEGNEDILCFDVHPDTGLAVTGTKNKVCLWDLNKGGSLIQIFSKHITPNTLSFNSSGSHIAAAEYQPIKKRSIIREWSAQTYKNTLTTDTPFHICNISYLHNTSKRIVVFTDIVDNYNLFETLYSLDEETPICLGDKRIFFPPSDITGFQYKDINTQNYYARHPHNTNFPKTLYITKKNCFQLGLCIRAIENSSKTTFINKLQLSRSYKELTNFEQEKLDKSIQRKIESIDKK